MLFKKLHSKFDKDLVQEIERKTSYEEQVEEAEEVSEDELAKRRLKLWKKTQRRKKLKKGIILFFLGIAVVGGYKSMLQQTPVVAREETADSVFLQEYLKAYFEYPKSEESSKLLEKFTLKNDEDITYPEEIVSERVSNVGFYNVKAVKGENKLYKYYARVSLQVTRKDQKPVTETQYVRLDMAKQGARYLIVRPISFVDYDIKGIVDEGVVASLALEPEHTNTSLDENETKQITQTLNLFFKTYSDDYTQAKLLVTGSSVIDKLDSAVKLSLQNVISSSQDDEMIYLQVRAEENDTDVIRIRNYYIEVVKESNKIRKMEVY